MKTRFESLASRAVRLAGLVLGVAGLAAAGPAPAQHRPHPGGPGWHGDIARFHDHDWGLWRSGHWVHQRHDGRLGWWWVLGSTWYFYPSPMYPYPSPWEPPVAVLSPPPGAVPAPPPTAYWYLCEASKTYYPYVASCPGGWKQVPAAPAPQPK